MKAQIWSLDFRASAYPKAVFDLEILYSIKTLCSSWQVGNLISSLSSSRLHCSEYYLVYLSAHPIISSCSPITLLLVMKVILLSLALFGRFVFGLDLTFASGVNCTGRAEFGRRDLPSIPCYNLTNYGPTQSVIIADLSPGDNIRFFSDSDR